MVQGSIRFLTLAAVATLLVAALGAEARAVEPRRSNSGDLFYNYYTDPGYGGMSAAMYPCPRPTPPLVGQTYITYQPLMPHEFLYQHRRTYNTSHPDGSSTVTKVKWGWNPLLVPSRLKEWPKPALNASYPQHF